MKAIIICAGEGTRWNDYLGVTKHFIEIDGEAILWRLVRLLNEKGIRPLVVTKNVLKRNHLSYSNYLANLSHENYDADKFLSSKALWDREGRTVVFYGDVYYTQEAVDRIVGYKKKKWTLFARPYGSSFTGCPWPECFAQSFYPKDIARHEKALYAIRDLYGEGKISRCGGWEHYKYMTRQNMFDSGLEYVKDIEIIDDFTEDFDSPDDYKNFIERFYA